MNKKLYHVIFHHEEVFFARDRGEVEKYICEYEIEDEIIGIGEIKIGDPLPLGWQDSCCPHGYNIPDDVSIFDIRERQSRNGGISFGIDPHLLDRYLEHKHRFDILLKNVLETIIINEAQDNALKYND
jgi:hypothetical protein